MSVYSMRDTPVIAPREETAARLTNGKPLSGVPVPAAPPRPQIGWAGVALGLGACAAMLLILENYIGIYMPDDAYITYRYAENLATGHGLVFNAATAPVEGYSNLSWIIVLAGLARLGQDLTIWAARLGQVLSVLNLLLV